MRNEARKPKSRMISFRVDEDYLSRLDALAQQTSYSRAEVLRRCLVGAPLKSTVDAQALTDERGEPYNVARRHQLPRAAKGVRAQNVTAIERGLNVLCTI